MVSIQPGSSKVTDGTGSGMINNTRKPNLGTTLKAKIFGGPSHDKGIALRKVENENKQPKSSIRKCVKLIKNRKKTTMFGSNDGRLNFIKLNNEALAAVFG